MFKQHYTYFQTLFHPHVFPKNTNNITKNLLPNGLYLLIGVNSRIDGLNKQSQTLETR